MTTITTIGIDLAKKAFQVHGVDADGTQGAPSTHDPYQTFCRRLATARPNHRITISTAHLLPSKIAIVAARDASRCR